MKTRDRSVQPEAPDLQARAALSPPQAALEKYEAGLLAQVGDRLLRQRTTRANGSWVERILEALENPVIIDRRLRELEGPALGLLALLGRSRQSTWRLGGLLELLSCLGAADGLPIIFDLFERGLLYPDLSRERGKLRSFEHWLGQGAASGFRVHVHSTVAARALAAAPELPSLSEAVRGVENVREADGLELFLRLAALWQLVRLSPLRLTQQKGFFKRDLERLSGDPLLTASAADEVLPLLHPGLFLAGLGLQTGMLRQREGQLEASDEPLAWPDDLAAAIGLLWSQLPGLDCWNAADGWRGLDAAGSPYGSAALVALTLLGQLPEKDWATPAAVATWLAERHCWWNQPRDEEEEEEEEGSTPPAALDRWTEGFLLGLAYWLRLVQAGQTADGDWAVRLSPLGRGVLGFASFPAAAPFPRTLLVQPNLEVVAYRQGLTPGLIAALTRFADWKQLGAACTLKLEPQSVYRGLETGMTLEGLQQLLTQHGVRETPLGVVHSLRTWADKRERITIHAAAALLEFPTAAELEAALGRGLPGMRISETMLLVPDEQAIDFRHFRLIGNRDYGLPPEECVAVAEDGITLTVDSARADLLLEAELRRFAEPVPSANGQRAYRLTPASLLRGRESGLGAAALNHWFQQRTGRPLSPAAQLLLADASTPPLAAESLLVLHAPSPELAEGLLQWPGTRDAFAGRLGPRALIVKADQLEPLAAQLRALGLAFRREGET